MNTNWEWNVNEYYFAKETYTKFQNIGEGADKITHIPISNFDWWFNEDDFQQSSDHTSIVQQSLLTQIFVEKLPH